MSIQNGSPETMVQGIVTTPGITVQVTSLFEELASQSHLYGKSEAVNYLEEVYANGSRMEPMSRLALLLLHAGQHAKLQTLLDSDREALHGGRLDHEQRIETSNHYETLRHAACEYNHAVRSFIESHREDVTRDQLVDWLSQASLGNHRWADGEVTGATSEIALHAALMGMPELAGLRYATLEEDLHGFDFTAEWQGQEVTIDAKTGRYAPIVERMRGHRHLEIYVPRDAMEGFRLTRHGLDSLRREMRVALAQAARLQMAI